MGIQNYILNLNTSCLNSSEDFLTSYPYPCQSPSADLNGELVKPVNNNPIVSIVDSWSLLRCHFCYKILKSDRCSTWLQFGAYLRFNPRNIVEWLKVLVICSIVAITDILILTYIAGRENNGTLKDELWSRFEKSLVESGPRGLLFQGGYQSCIVRKTAVQQEKAKQES